MKHYEKRERVVQLRDELVGITCDRCAATCSSPTNTSQSGASFTLDFGYGSRYDMDTRQYDLCDDCCDALEAWAKPSPSVRETT